MKKILIKGQRLQFVQATEDDLPYIMEVENRKGNIEYIIPYSLDEHKKTINSVDASHLIIEKIASSEKIGFLMLHGLNSPHKEIEWHRIIVDDKDKGYGTETLALLKKLSFDILKFHRAVLDAKDYNKRALHVYEKAGLKREAFLRETILNNGVYENLVVLAILEDEYQREKEANFKDK